MEFDNPYAQEMSRLMLSGQFVRLRDRARESSPFTPEGKKARVKLQRFIDHLHGLAAASGSSQLVRCAQEIEGQLRAVSPNLFPGGSIN